MKAPGYIQRELKLIDPLYFAVYNRRTRMWNIRKWLCRNPINQVFWELNSNLVKRVVGNEITAKDLFELREGLYNALRARYIARKIDEHNMRLQEAADKEDDYQHRAAAKAIYHHYNEPTVCLGGN